MARFLRRVPWLGPTIFFAVLLILGARAHPLWGDEAETGIIGRNILSYGLPKAWDGVNILGLQNGLWLNKNLVNRANSWSQYYVAAVAFRFLPINSFTARLPFIVISVAGFAFWYTVTKKVTGSREAALLHLLLLLTCVQYILFAFQARYYAITMASGMLLFWLVGRLTERSWWPKVVFVLVSATYLYTHYLSYVIFTSTLFVVYLVYRVLKRDSKKEILRYIIQYSVLTLVALALFYPWYRAYQPFAEGTVIALPNLDELALWPQILWAAYLPFNQSNVFPILAVFFVIWAFWLVRRDPAKRSMFWLLIGIPVGYLVMFTNLTLVVRTGTSFVQSRYYTVLIPFWILLLAFAFWQIWLKYKKIALGGLVLFIATNILTLPQKPASLLVSYAGEVLFPYPTSPLLVSNYLKEHAKDGETVFVTSDREHEPLIFLLNKKLKFVNRLSATSPYVFPENRHNLPRYLYMYLEKPDWIIEYSKHPRDESFLYFDVRDWRNFPGLDLQRDYEETVIPVYFADLSRPELELHEFSAIKPKLNEQVFIYRRRK